MKKPAIPSTMPVQDRIVASVLGPLKENVEIITGIRSGILRKLDSDASLQDVIAKVNEVIERLNAHE